MIRVVEPDDATRLRWFRCLPDPFLDIDEDDNDLVVEDPEDEDGVEEFCRRAYQWWDDPFNDTEPMLLVREAEDGTIIGVAASHRSLGPVHGRYILVVAVATHRHGEGIGRELLRAMIAECATAHPGGVAFWLVRKTNVASIEMCRAIEGAERIENPDNTDFWLYRFPLDV